MAPNTRVLNTIFGPYRTSQAIQRAEFADFIPVPTSNTDINAVYPIPIQWLRDELLPRELAQVREHMVSLLSESHTQSTAFIAAVNETLDNLDAILDGHGNRPRSATAQSPSGSPRGVRFAGVDNITRDVDALALGGTRSLRPSSRPVSILRNPSSTTPQTSNVRQPSPNRDALVAIEVHLNEIESRIDRRFEGEFTAETLRQCRDGIASARSHIARARTFSLLSTDDVEMARAMVDSVYSIAEARPASRRRRSPARTTPVHAWDRFSRQARRGARQAQLRERAARRHQIPLFRSGPVEPFVGDGLLLPGDGVLRLSPSGRWLRYHHPYVGGGGVYLLEEE